MRDIGLYNDDDPLQVECLRFCYMDVLRKELHQVAKEWNVDKMQELRDKIPFHCIITGPTNCGKMQYLVEKLRGPFIQRRIRLHLFDLSNLLTKCFNNPGTCSPTQTL